jgi:hypothetical protein
MDLAKFVSLLFNRALHFARADTLGDPFEGSITKLQYDLRDKIVAHRHTDPRFAEWRAMSDDVLQKMFSHQAAFNKQATSFCYINCWHMNAHESAAMWRLYSQSDEAVCIQSTFKRLAEGMPSYVQAGEVNYIDYENGIIPVGNILNLFLTKRLSFSHESELRAIILAPPPNTAPIPSLPFKVVDNSVFVPIDLEQLVETIRVSPTSKDWFKDIIERLVEAQGIKIPVQQSSLSAAPLF